MSEETKLQTTTDVVTEQDKGRCAPAPGSAESLATAIASDLLTPFREPECDRLQIMRGKHPNEQGRGGWCKAALIQQISKHLVAAGYPPNDALNHGGEHQ
jgi:hypothetical protein